MTSPGVSKRSMSYIRTSTVVAMLPVRRGQKIDLSVAVEPRPHLLEVRSLASEGVVPVLVRLADGSGGPATDTPPAAP